MRFLKILLIICSLFVVCSALYVIFLNMTTNKANNMIIPFVMYLYLGIAIITSLLNIVYHIKSFRFYMRKEKQNLDKKLPKILWIGTVCFSAFLLYIAASNVYSLILLYEYGYVSQYLFLVIIFLIPALMGFFEVSILQKRIKRLRLTRTTKDEITNIGNSTL